MRLFDLFFALIVLCSQSYLSAQNTPVPSQTAQNETQKQTSQAKDAKNKSEEQTKKKKDCESAAAESEVVWDDHCNDFQIVAGIEQAGSSSLPSQTNFFLSGFTGLSPFSRSSSRKSRSSLPPRTEPLRWALWWITTSARWFPPPMRFTAGGPRRTLLIYLLSSSFR